MFYGKEGFERAAAFMAAQGDTFDFEFKKAEVLEKQTAAAAVSFEKEQAKLEKLQAETEEIKEGDTNEGSKREDTAAVENSRTDSDNIHND